MLDSTTRPVVSKVRFATPSGRFAGVGTRVVLADGYRQTLMGHVSKGMAVAQVLSMRAHGVGSEVQP